MSGPVTESFSWLAAAAVDRVGAPMAKEALMLPLLDGPLLPQSPLYPGNSLQAEQIS